MRQATGAARRAVTSRYGRGVARPSTECFGGVTEACRVTVPPTGVSLVNHGEGIPILGSSGPRLPWEHAGNCGIMAVRPHVVRHRAGAGVQG
ncbi:hypothetical protein GJR88_01975 [Dietzia sp. DQ12-45-1b]|nr:hypothetical protein GJR88_01975 [Dietzia sp. DQ12-45-1b]